MKVVSLDPSVSELLAEDPAIKPEPEKARPYTAAPLTTLALPLMTPAFKIYNEVCRTRRPCG